MTIEEVSATVKQEGQSLDDVFPDKEPQAEEAPKPESDQEGKETSPVSPAEEKPEGDTQSSEGDNTQDVKDEPFHKRWKEQREKLNREWEDRLQSTIQQFEEKLSQFKPTESATQVPSWVTKIYGESPEGQQFYKEWKADQERQLAEFKSQIIAEQQQLSQKERQEQERWTGWVKEQLDELKEEGLTFDANELQKVALEFMPTDENGNIDFRKAYAIYEKVKQPSVNPAKSQAKKELAAATTSKPSAETKPQEFHTPSTLRNKSFSELVRGK